MRFCDECFDELQRHNKNKCDECLSSKVIEKVEAKIKRKTVEVEMFKPEDEGKTWERVKSPYKKYKEGV